jgi:hypothetical protein
MAILPVFRCFQTSPSGYHAHSPSLSIHTYAWNSGTTEEIFVKFDNGEFYETLSSCLNFHLYWTYLTTTLHEHLSEFLSVHGIMLN